MIRLLALYAKLIRGKVINKQVEADYFGVNKRTIQRDIQRIRDYYRDSHDPPIETALSYSTKEKCFLLKSDLQYWLTHCEVLAISKILLESRAFTKKELDYLLDKLILQSIPEE